MVAALHIARTSDHGHPQTSDACLRTEQSQLYAERFVHGSCPTVGGHEPRAMLTGGRADERVVDSAARDPEASDLQAQGTRLILAKEPRRGKVVGQQAERIGRGPTTRAR